MVVSVTTETIPKPSKTVHFQTLLACVLLLRVVEAVGRTVELTYCKYKGAALQAESVNGWGFDMLHHLLGNLRFMPSEDPLHNEILQIADKASLRLG